MDRGHGFVSPGRRTSLGRESTSVGTGSERCREGKSVRLLGGVRSVTARFSHGSGPTVALQRMPLVARVPSVRPVVECGGLLAVLRDCCRSFGW